MLYLYETVTLTACVNRKSGVTFANTISTQKNYWNRRNSHRDHYVEDDGFYRRFWIDATRQSLQCYKERKVLWLIKDDVTRKEFVSSTVPFYILAGFDRDQVDTCLNLGATCVGFAHVEVAVSFFSSTGHNRNKTVIQPNEEELSEQGRRSLERCRSLLFTKQIEKGPLNTNFWLVITRRHNFANNQRNTSQK